MAACGDDDGSGSDTGSDRGSAAVSVPESADFNEADVVFATDMVQHHAQALAMVDMTTGRDLDPEVADLVEQIRSAQAPEIEQMVDWLTAWDQPVPPTVNDHANAHAEDGTGTDGSGGMDMDSDMPGMMSDAEMDALEEAPDASFQEEWLEMMVAHHEGAVEMAETEAAEGEDADAVALAESIVDSQSAEIEQMRALLGA
ncbi:hypothetical protein ASF50_03085 [Nocardioides sp. Leaf307]|nr:hypothetical protein ASF50_03085 [Nocardioides sp. Leaf307]